MAATSTSASHRKRDIGSIGSVVKPAATKPVAKSVIWHFVDPELVDELERLCFVIVKAASMTTITNSTGKRTLHYIFDIKETPAEFGCVTHDITRIICRDRWITYVKSSGECRERMGEDLEDAFDKAKNA